MIPAESISWPAITSEDAKSLMSSLLKKRVRCKMYQVANSGKLISPEEEPSSSKLPNNVPAFLMKLWTLVNDPKTDNLVCWSVNGKSFIIKDQTRFEKELLPYYYKHNHMASFVRQLNMYGFHKKISAELGGLKCDKDEMEFAHEYFCIGQPSLLIQIKRKIANSKTQNQDTGGDPTLKRELMSKMLSEVRCLQGRQEQFDYKLALMKNENTLLWKELMILRQKHLHQQEIVNKLIHFLITLVQSRRGNLTVKRCLYPLMIDDSSRPRKKNKLSEPQASPTGPVIHELSTSEPGLDSEYIVADEMEDPAVQSPQSIDEYVQIPMDNKIEEDIKIPHSDIMQYNAFNESMATAERHVAAETEELHLLEMPDDRQESPETIITTSKNESIDLKPPVPVATVRSSKLAAMVANMKKSQEDIDQELDIETSIDEDISDNDTSSLVNFGDILPDTNVPNNDNMRNNIENKTNAGRRPSKMNKGFNHIYGGKSVLKSNNNRNWHDKNVATKSTCEEKRNYDKASTSSSKDLSLSCVNSSGMSDTNYREELDNHLESMQAELDNIRDMLRGDGYKIDANTLLGLFSSDDSISFGLSDLPLSINSELNPEMNYEKMEEKEENTFQIPESESRFNRGEVMAYSSGMDFEHLLSEEGQSSFRLLMEQPEAVNTDSILNSDPLNLENGKTSFFSDPLEKDMNSSP
ncbi:heat shock factor protein 1-like isoform X2 [Odontomachus brunneus]|uniref:heat shock factor protein 1-like isoform X2 n=1 Tax=Odontomachus brunneus TaxID=486640 RepID=UPI0013F1CF33|nr:heat shock factor protein 1-like isoform X2 [Odontomachus brunneus]